MIHLQFIYDTYTHTSTLWYYYVDRQEEGGALFLALI